MPRDTVSPCSMGIVFTGDGGISIQAFLRWMESWFARMGDDFDGATVASKKRRVAQIHVACPIQSVAGSFLRTLSNKVLWDEDVLKDKLIEQFDNAEMDGQVQEDILSTMSTIRQGAGDVFSYSQKDLKLLQKRPEGLRQYHKILIRYYIDGLESQRLREMAILSFLKPDSCESPNQVEKGVTRFATQLQIKGYKEHDSDHDDDEESNAEESSGLDNSASDSESDAEVYYGHSRKARKSKLKMRSEKPERQKRKSKHKKKQRGSSEKDVIRGEVQELREMMRDLMKLQKAAVAPAVGKKAEPEEADLIPLDNYAMTRNPERLKEPNYYSNASERYRYPPRERHGEGSRQMQVPLELSQYEPTYRGHQTSYSPSRYQEASQPTTFNLRQEFSQQRPSEDTLDRQANSSQQPIIGPNGVYYYPSRPRVCFYCYQEGHLRSYCPKLHPPREFQSSQNMRPHLMRPQYSDPRDNTLESKPNLLVQVIEVAPPSSALQEMKVREVIATSQNEVDLADFIEEITEDQSEDEANGHRAVPVMAGERARRFSELPVEFEGEPGPASQSPRIDEPGQDLTGRQDQRYQVTRILVDAGSVVNLIPIRLLRYMKARLQRSGGMVIHTATNALAKISYCADIRVTVARVSCDLRVYALPAEYTPTYPMLLSRRWLQAVKAMGDYASGRYYIMTTHGTRVRIPSNESYKSNRDQNSGQTRRPKVPIVLRDKTMDKSGLSAEVEEELEWQESGGTGFFERLIDLIKQEAKEQIREEDREEGEEEEIISDESEN
ncbi:hypothetical protein HOY82DRAFT_601806 [Tuber indicum]|nr:hypothetical protein HOY82DRAFT_601806 [Tuber indicum]